MKFYTGLPITSPLELSMLHITTTFAPMVKTGRLKMHERVATGNIVEVVYWANCNKTVALVSCPVANDRFKYWTGNGFIYDYEYKPHITLCDDNRVDEFKRLEGSWFRTGPEYLRMF